MSLADIYAEMHRDFEQRVKKVTINAKEILSKYPHDFEDELLSIVVEEILIKNRIDAYDEVSDTQWSIILNEKTLFNAILAYYLTVLDSHLFRQTNWLKRNDVPTEQNDIDSRREFLDSLYDILLKKYEEHNVEESIQNKLKQVNELSHVIINTNIESFKDTSTLHIIDVVASLLKLFCMSIFYPLYSDPIISNKCNMGHGYGTLWSGKSLNTIHIEHLKAKLDQLEHVGTIVSNSLKIPQEEIVSEFSNYSK